jgi:3D (Asp-Asp-Asp) domain-containing protein
MRMKSNKVFLIFVVLMMIIQIIATIIMIKVINRKEVSLPPIAQPTSTETTTTPAITLPSPTPKPDQEGTPEETTTAAQMPPATVEHDRPTVGSSRGDEHYIDEFIGDVTLYTEGYKSCGKKPGHPLYGITASGKYVKANHTIAMDKRFPFGTLVKVEGFDETFEVEDRGGAIKGNDVDIYIPEQPDGEKIADEWGIKKRTIRIIKMGEK